MDSKALTKIHSAILVAVIVVAALGGGAGYTLWMASQPPPENIRIGICADIDATNGKDTWQGATLAAEQINSEGGILGRNITIISEDDDSGTPPYDVAVAINALTKLITVDRADYVIANSMALPYQDICSEHKKILITLFSTSDNLTQRVLDNYDKYKYYFRTSPPNETTIFAGTLGDVLTVINYTGFTKIALLFLDSSPAKRIMEGLRVSLPPLGFNIVYTGLVPTAPPDFASYFAAIEASGAEILYPYIASPASTTSLVKEWYTRQSPCVIWGTLPPAAESNFWEATEGKCDTISFAAPAAGFYPVTNKTIPTMEAYKARWGEGPGVTGVSAYDTIRFILSDAIKRAGTTETEAVIKALEKTNVETSSARHFVFTSSHDVMVGSENLDNPADNTVMCTYQWQNGTRIIVKPASLMKETGANYKYPSWQGPWSK